MFAIRDVPLGQCQRPAGVPVHAWGRSVGIPRRRVWAWPLLHERDAAYERRIVRTLEEG